MRDTSSLFDAKYYQNALGLAYERNDYWVTFFSAIAENIIRSLRPQSVFDAGCGMGFLVESLWDHGVEARGIDISEFGISQVRRDIRPYCRQASLTDPIEGHYDLVTCIEVLEHLLPEQTETAIANLASVTDAILFSSTPNELSEPTHFNVRPTIAWLKLFKDVGFWPDYAFDATFLCPHAILLRKQLPPPEDSLFLMSDLVRWKVAFVARDRQAIELTKQQQNSAALLRQMEDLRTKSVGKQQQDSAALLREVDDLRATIAANEARLRKMTAEADVYRRKLTTNRTALDTACAEVSSLKAWVEGLKSGVKTTNLLLRPAFIEMARNEVGRQAASFRGLAASFLGQVRLAVTRRRSGLLKEHANLLRQLDMVASSPLFDPVWYLSSYPDVAASKMNPLTHYLRHGGLEGRHPSPGFDGAWYLETYPDVTSAGINPLVHYLEFGAVEGRVCRAVSGEQGVAQLQVSAEGDSLQAVLLRQRELLASSSLFDTAWYLEEYPDVALEGLDPLIHYLQHGISDARNPGPEFDGEWYLRNYPDVAEAGVNPLIHYLQNGQNEARTIRALAAKRPVDVLLRDQFSDSVPIASFSVPDQRLRITVVTDTLEMKEPFGVSVALVLAGLLARKAGASLRIITRRQPASASSFGDILAANGITWQDDAEFLYAPISGSRAIGVSDNEVFLTTSWRNISAVRTLVDPARIIALLQEDERMLYPPCDERLRCEETLRDAEISYLVNSQALFEKLTSGPEPLESVRRQGIWFDPAFPQTKYDPPEENDSQSKKKLFFYASRHSTTNLYWRGLEALAAAIENGVLLVAEWEFHFFGSGVEPVNLPAGATVRTHGSQEWKDYLSLIRNMDLAVCLTGAGFSSYPQLELAAAGAVVVTNFGEPSLSRYSKNIISTNPGMDELGTALAAAAKLAGDQVTRRANYEHSSLLHDWNEALEVVTQRMAERIGSQG